MPYLSFNPFPVAVFLLGLALCSCSDNGPDCHFEEYFISETDTSRYPYFNIDTFMEIRHQYNAYDTTIFFLVGREPEVWIEDVRPCGDIVSNGVNSKYTDKTGTRRFEAIAMPDGSTVNGVKETYVEVIIQVDDLAYRPLRYSNLTYRYTKDRTSEFYMFNWFGTWHHTVGLMYSTRGWSWTGYERWDTSRSGFYATPYGFLGSSIRVKDIDGEVVDTSDYVRYVY